MNNPAMTKTKAAPKTHRFHFGLPFIVSLAVCVIRSLSRSSVRDFSAIREVISKKVTPNIEYSTLLDSFTPHEAPRFIVLLTCSDGFFEMWLNWLEFFKDLRIPNLPVHLFAEDGKTHEKCIKLLREIRYENRTHSEDDFVIDLVCLSWDTVFPQLPEADMIGALGYRAEGYKVMMSHRPVIVQYELANGYNVIFSDVDVVWLRSPLPYFEGDFMSANIWAQRDGQKKGGDFLCPGFMVYRSCPQTIKFVDQWRRDIGGKSMRNQKAFNFLLSKSAKFGLEIEAKTLPIELFTTGNLYFNEMTDAERSKVVVVHNNGISGYQNKVSRMKDFNLWRG